MNGKKNRKKVDHSGSSFDSFLEQEGIREEVEAVAIKRVLAWRLEQAMQKQRKTKQAMARQLRTSRSQLDRLLDPRNVSVTLDTITRAARALGKRVIIHLADVKAGREGPIKPGIPFDPLGQQIQERMGRADLYKDLTHRRKRRGQKKTFLESLAEAAKDIGEISEKEILRTVRTHRKEKRAPKITVAAEG